MKIKTYERIQLLSLLIGLILCVLSIYFDQIEALQFGLLFVGISVLLFFFDVNLRHRLKIYSLMLEIENPELRQYGYESLNQLEKMLKELASDYLTIVNPFQARDIAFDFLKKADENIEILATQDFVSRPQLFEDERKRYFFLINKEASERKAKIKRIFVVDNETLNNPLFTEYCRQLINIGCEIYHVHSNIFYNIIDKDFIISMNKKDNEKSKVLIGGRDKPEDEYIAKLSYRNDDIRKYQSKFDILLKSSEKFEIK